MISIKDMIKRSVLETFEQGAITMPVILLSIACTLILALYLFFIYRMLCKKTFYNMNFNLSLVGMTVMTAAIVLAVQSNLVLSLGMVGALSIVRYRSAVKDPLDLFFLFWGVAIGIMCGAQQYILAVLITFILTIVLYFLSHLPVVQAPYVLVVNGDKSDLNMIKDTVKSRCKYHEVKSNHISPEGKLRMIIAVKTTKQDELLEELSSKEGLAVSMLTYEGDILG